jgi:hypothetical protein
MKKEERRKEIKRGKNHEVPNISIMVPSGSHRG